MAPKVLAVIAMLIVMVSGVAMAMAPSSTPPEGLLAEDSLAITVGDPSFLPITGAELGLLVGAGLLLISLGWYLATRKRESVSA